MSISPPRRNPVFKEEVYAVFKVDDHTLVRTEPYEGCLLPINPPLRQPDCCLPRIVIDPAKKA